MTEFIDLKAEDLKYLPRGTHVYTTDGHCRFQEVEEGMAVFLKGKCGDYASILPLESIREGRAKLPAGDPATVHNNVCLFKQLPLMDESVGSREEDRAAYNAQFFPELGYIVEFSNDSREKLPVATFVCKLNLSEPMRVERINISGFDKSPLHVPIQESGIPEKAKRNLFETAYRMNRHFEEIFEKYLEKNRKGCRAWLWPFGR